MILLSGKKASKDLLEKVKTELRESGWTNESALPRLSILVFSSMEEDWNDGVKAYVSGIFRAFSGILEIAEPDFPVEVHQISSEIKADDFRSFYKGLNENLEIAGILPLAPYPSKEIETILINETAPEKDLDRVSFRGQEAFRLHPDLFVPCTAEAVLELLSFYDIPIEGRKAVVIGRSPRVGKPVAALLSKHGASVTVCHSKTENLREICKEADILAVACGKKKMIDASYVKPGAVVIDCGMHKDPNNPKGFFGDCDFDAVSKAAGALTPVPGGVGALTSAVLVKNYARAIGKKADRNRKGESMEIQIKYFSDEIEPLRYIDGKSDWIDLRCAKETVLKKGEFTLIPLGVAMKLPAGYEALVVSRSSTFKNFGILQANAIGIIDETYSGDDDQWFFPALPTRDVTVHVNDRICQFRILEHQPHIDFTITDHLDDESRGGFGSTGI